MFTVENFIRGFLSCVHNISAQIEEHDVVFSKIYPNDEGGENFPSVIGKIPISELQTIESDLIDGVAFTDGILNIPNSFEVPVKPQERMRMPFRYYERDIYSCNEHGYEFNISKASNEYVFALFCYAAENPEHRLDLGMFYHSIRRTEYIATLEDIISSLRLLTAKIDSPKNHSISEYKRAIQSYLFNVAYNFNVAFVTTDLREEERMTERSVRRGGQLFPFKAYKSELMKYYFQGMSTDIPFTQYLAYYHVIEFFFQTIAEHEAFSEIEDFITRPSFSPHKKEDIRAFYNRIKKRMRDQRDDGVWDERTGLLLTLKGYVPDVGMLKTSISTINTNAIAYYGTNDVEFADDGKRINFDEVEEQVYIAIRNRVYSVRNAIVHSKEGDKLRYEPFKHDSQLAKEIPLVRAIAEEVIINSSKTIEWNFDI